MKAFDIIYTWKHVQGHVVEQKLNTSTIYAEDGEIAIEMFKDLKPSLGQYINKDSDGDWRYGSYSSFPFDFGDDKYQLIKAKEVDVWYL